jgi:ethylbenzene dehydrogenase
MRKLCFVVLAGCAQQVAPPPSPHEVRARLVRALPLEPDHPAWATAPEHVARLLVQDVTEPKLTVPGVDKVAVRALHDGNRIAFRLQWQDGTRDVLSGVSRFSDAAGVQLPLGTSRGSDVPDAAMGAAGRPVRILYWRASWQETRDPIAALYPNAAIDHYYPATKALPRSPVQDLVAEGFGTLTPAAEQRAVGDGTWAAGAWTTTIALPLDAPGQGALVPGARTYVALAVWDGAAGHVGARKMRSQWIPLALDSK